MCEGRMIHHHKDISDLSKYVSYWKLASSNIKAVKDILIRKNKTIHIFFLISETFLKKVSIRKLPCRIIKKLVWNTSRSDFFLTIITFYNYQNIHKTIYLYNHGLIVNRWFCLTSITIWKRLLFFIHKYEIPSCFVNT